MLEQQVDRHPLELKTGVDVDATLTAHVEHELRVYLGRQRAAAASIDEAFASAVGALSDFVVSGGKRIRPTFAWWGWRAAGGDPDDLDTVVPVLRAVSALELIQACALVQDDLMDDSDMRRGLPTVHVAFGAKHREQGWSGSAERFGLSAALLLGDLALVWADDMVRTSGLGLEALARTNEAWHGMRTEVLAGQYLDVLAQARAATDLHSAEQVSRYKTAAYTVDRPLHFGAALAGADQELVAALRCYGADVGIAFQLRDDLLGVFGDPAVTGKPAGDDLREGKRTPLVAYGLDLAHRAGETGSAELIESALGVPELDGGLLERVRATLIRLGAVRAVEERINRLTTSGLAALDSVTIDSVAVTRLRELALEVTHRSY
ncbi:polyprenyl synthetase family protein [Allokutzneria albata]|uniref:polyprenyl synthetase family protein n=1 Tax=Allokutzneria albata TaxID=211114 RepID=UPI000AC43300|nr:polyprenyl synthetase family protein [Allokutzneria albata]